MDIFLLEIIRSVWAYISVPIEITSFIISIVTLKKVSDFKKQTRDREIKKIFDKDKEDISRVFKSYYQSIDLYDNLPIKTIEDLYEYSCEISMYYEPLKYEFKKPLHKLIKFIENNYLNDKKTSKTTLKDRADIKKLCIEISKKIQMEVVFYGD